jgi:hypothetical protein
LFDHAPSVASEGRGAQDARPALRHDQPSNAGIDRFIVEITGDNRYLVTVISQEVDRLQGDAFDAAASMNAWKDDRYSHGPELMVGQG